MSVTVDTNVLVRLVVADDEAQGRLAIETMEAASAIAITVPSLCELCWVLDRRYAVPRQDIAAAIRGLLEADKVAVDRPLVEAGLRMLEAGGDFADGVIAHDGLWLGGETFVSFDRKAVRLLAMQGRSAKILN